LFFFSFSIQNRNGALSFEEFKNAVRRINGPASDQDINKLFKSFDLDSNGKVTLEG